MNTKGQFFGATLVVIAILVLVFGLVNISLFGAELNKFVGDDQSDLLSQYAEGENLLYYIDESVRLSLEENLGPFFSSGLKSGCGSKEGVYFWKNASQSCIPFSKEAGRNLVSRVLNPINFRLNESIYYSIPLFGEGDLYVVSEEGTNRLLGYPFEYISLGENYHFSTRFSAELPSFLLEEAQEVISRLNEDCSGLEDINVLNKTEFSDCVKETLQTFKDSWKSNTECESEFETFVREYNECANTYDDFCRCDVDSAYSEYEINRTNKDQHTITHLDKTLDLGSPLDTDSEQKLPLYKSDGEMQTFDRDARVPVCRINRRIVKLCKEVDYRNQPINLRFNVYVDDNKKPEAVSSTKSGDTYSWNPSVSPDVEKYLIFEAKEGSNFPNMPITTINRSFRSSEVLNYTASSGFNARVIAVDFNGNK
jgi:hypothetical protein